MQKNEEYWPSLQSFLLVQMWYKGVGFQSYCMGVKPEAAAGRGDPVVPSLPVPCW